MASEHLCSRENDLTKGPLKSFSLSYSYLEVLLGKIVYCVCVETKEPTFDNCCSQCYRWFHNDSFEMGCALFLSYRKTVLTSNVLNLSPVLLRS